MGQMASIRKKLRESIFFFRHLSNEEKAFDLEAEDAVFFLSAFLSAGRSLIELFCKVHRPWFLHWESALPDYDRKFLNDMRLQRNLEVHEGGADVIPQFKPVLTTELRAGADAPHVHYWSGPPLLSPPHVLNKNYYFLLDGKELDLNSACQRYLELLMKLADDFEESGWRGLRPSGHHH
jgi:hypothetical protein